MLCDPDVSSSTIHCNELTLKHFEAFASAAVHSSVCDVMPTMASSGHQLSDADERRLAALFERLDVNGDGRVDVNDLTAAFTQLGVHHVPGQAERFIARSDRNSSGDLSLSEFVRFVHEHEKRLRLVFGSLDSKRDGRLDAEEVSGALQRLGLAVDRGEADRLLRRIDPDGSLEIGYREWCDYLMFHPSAELHDIVEHWRKHAYLDVGEDINMPDDYTSSELTQGMWWRHLVSGAAAGAVSRTMTAPLDRLKVFLQVHGRSHFCSIRHCWRHMLNEGGVSSLWRGNGVNVLKIAPESALKFVAYEYTKRALRGDRTCELTIGERFCAGSVAGAFSQTLIYPLEVLKTRLALRQTGQYRGIADALVAIYRREGLRSFYRGYVPNLLGIIPYAGIDLAVYETLKQHYMRTHATPQSKPPASSDPGVAVLLACGAVSSTCGQIASYPLALVRTRLQAAAAINTCDGTYGRVGDDVMTMRGQFRAILQQEGLLGLYRGLAPNFLKVAPAVSISYVVYEKCRQALGVTMT